MPVERDPDKRGDREHVRAARTHGRWAPDPELLPKYRQAVRLWAEGMNSADVAREMGIDGPNQKAAARKARNWIRRGLQLWRPEGVEEMRALENSKLDDSEAILLEVVRNPGWAYGSSGRPVIDPETGSPIVNRHVIIAAQRALKSLRDRRAALNGLDTPVPVHVRVALTPDMDREIERLANDLAMNGPGPRLELERGRDWTSEDSQESEDAP